MAGRKLLWILAFVGLLVLVGVRRALPATRHDSVGARSSGRYRRGLEGPHLVPCRASLRHRCGPRSGRVHPVPHPLEPAGLPRLNTGYEISLSRLEREFRLSSVIERSGEISVSIAPTPTRMLSCRYV